MFNVELFYNTGFDAINIPDSPNVLYNDQIRRSSTSLGVKQFYFPAIDIFQIDFLTEVAIKVRNEDDVIGADYLCLYEDIPDSGTGGNLIPAHQKRAFYAICGYRMTSPDVAVLNIVQDALNTVGGVWAIDIVDGMTERHHVDAAQDQFGAYTEEDPLLVPLDELELLHGGEPLLAVKPYHNTNKIAPGYDDKTSGAVSHDGSKWWKQPFVNGQEGQNGIGVCCDGYTGAFMDVESKANNGSTTIENWNSADTILVTTVDLHKMEDPTNVVPQFSGEVYECPKVPQCDMLHIQLPSPYIDPKYLMPCIDTHRQSKTATPSQWGPRHKDLAGLGAFILSSTSADDHATNEGLANLRGLGLDEAIINSYELHPMAGQFRGSRTSSSYEAYLFGYINFFCTKDRDIVLSSDNHIHYTGTPVRRMANSEVYDYLYRQTRNMRAMYGSMRKYIIASTATGDSVSCKPEDLIYAPFSSADGGNTNNDFAPTLVVLTDPGPDGAPYFNIVQRRVTGGDENQFINVMKNAIKGAPWKEVPLKFTGMSGYLRDKYSYKVASEFADFQTSEYFQNLARTAGNANIGSVAGSMASGAASAYMATGNPAGALVGAGSSFIGSMIDEIKTQFSFNTQGMGALGNEMFNKQTAAERIRELQRQQELSQFNIGHGYATPTIKFIPGDSARDINANGLLYMRLTPSVTDMQRFDDILDRFGYKITEKMSRYFLTNHNRQNYIKCNGVKVVMEESEKYISGGHPAIKNKSGWEQKYTRRASKELLDDVANQLNGGVRIWHVPRLTVDGTPVGYY